MRLYLWERSSHILTPVSTNTDDREHILRNMGITSEVDRHDPYRDIAARMCVQELGGWVLPLPYLMHMAACVQADIGNGCERHWWTELTVREMLESVRVHFGLDDLAILKPKEITT
jgi:hypothetical protein